MKEPTLSTRTKILLNSLTKQLTFYGHYDKHGGPGFYYFPDHVPIQREVNDCITMIQGYPRVDHIPVRFMELSLVMMRNMETMYIYLTLSSSSHDNGNNRQVTLALICNNWNVGEQVGYINRISNKYTT